MTAGTHTSTPKRELRIRPSHITGYVWLVLYVNGQRQDRILFRDDVVRTMAATKYPGVPVTRERLAGARTPTKETR